MADVFVKDPDEIKDYIFDWSAQMTADTDTIDGATVTATTGITKDSDSFTDTTVTVWLSGGTAGAVYEVECDITTAGGRTHSRTMTIKVRNL